MKIDFTKQELEYLIENCNFNEENGELDVLLLRNKGKSIISMSMELNLSEKTIKRRISSIKNKVRKVIER